MRPQFNVPMALYLCSEEMQDSGQTIVMGAGWYGRTALVISPGACIGDAKRDIAVEEIRDQWSDITNMEEAEIAEDGGDAFKFMAPLLG